MHLGGFALLLTLTLACHHGPESVSTTAPPTTAAAPTTIEEHDRNADSKSALVLPGAAVVHGKLGAGTSPDAHWFQLNVKDPVIVRLELAAITGVGATLGVFDGEHNRLLHASGTPGEALILPDVGCKKACLFEVVPAKNDAGGEFTLTVTTAAPTPRSEMEPNNRAVDAQPLAPGAAIDGHMAPADDEDWYQLVTGSLANQMLTVSLASPPDVRLQLDVVRASDQATIGSYRAPDVGEDLQIPNLAVPLAPETSLFLVVKSAWVPVPGGKSRRTSNPNVAYTIEAQAIPAPPGMEREPNEDAAHATILDLTQPTHTGFIAPKGESDWFQFHANVPSILHAELSGVDDVKSVLSLIDPAKKDEEKDNELAKADTGGTKEPQVLAGVAVPAGDNYLRVEGAWKKIDKKWARDYANAKQPYTLAITLDPDDGTWEREPNDKPAQASPVEVGKSYKGYMQPAGDVDWWRLEIKQPTTVAISVQPAPKCALRIAVRDAAKTGDEGLPAVIGMMDPTRIETETRLVATFEPGTYFIEISDKPRATNPEKPYVLTLK